MARSKKAAGGRSTPATVTASRAGIPFTLHPYDADTAPGSYGTVVADALGMPHERVFKTLVTEVDGTLTVAVVPVASALDLKALANAVGGKRAAMAALDAAERATGYVRGGISPLGQRKHLTTVIDSTASGFPTVCVSAGRRGLEIELSPIDLIRLTGAALADVARD